MHAIEKSAVVGSEASDLRPGAGAVMAELNSKTIAEGMGHQNGGGCGARCIRIYSIFPSETATRLMFLPTGVTFRPWRFTAGTLLTVCSYGEIFGLTLPAGRKGSPR
jgi:hypothetical protein